MSREKLAIFGGEPAVKVQAPKWPIIGEEETNRIINQLRIGKLSIADRSGVIAEFEDLFAKYHNIKYALATYCGTASLHSAIFGVGVEPGDEVIVPSFTWITTATSVLQSNAIPVFCDISNESFGIDPKDFEKKITKRTKAIIVVHLWGIPVEMEKIMNVARKHNIAVVEDSAQAHGAIYKGKKVGTIGDVGCFSFQATKSMCTGEGGMLITDELGIYERAMLLGHHPARLT